MFSAKVLVFGLKWLYWECFVEFRKKVVVFGQSGIIRVKIVVFGQSGFILAKMVVFGQKWL